MKSQVLHTTWCNISGEAAGGIWNWSLLGVKVLNVYWLRYRCMSSRYAVFTVHWLVQTGSCFSVAAVRQLSLAHFITRKHKAEWVAKTKPENIAAHVCATKVLRKFILWFSCASLSHDAKISCPGVVLLQRQKTNGSPKPHMRNIGKTRSSKPHSLTFPPSQFTHVWRIRSCDPDRSEQNSWSGRFQ